MHLDRLDRIRIVLWAVFFVNIGVAISRFLLFERTESTGIFADAIHAASDAGGNLWLLLFLWLANRPPDIKHPGGHGFRERFAIIGIALLILAGSGVAAWEAYGRLTSGRYPPFSLLDLSFFCGTILVGFTISRIEHRQSHTLRSRSLHADALHTLADVFASIAAALGYSFIAFGLPLGDPIAAFTVVVITLALSGVLLSGSRKPLETKTVHQHR